MIISLTSAFIAFCNIIFLLAFLEKFAAIKMSSLFSVLDDAALMLIAGNLVIGTILFAKEKQLLKYKVAIFLSVGFAIISTLINGKNIAAAGLQAFIDIKMLVIYLVGFSIVWSDRRDLVLKATILSLMVLSIIMVLFQWGAPGTSAAIFSGSVENSYLARWLPTRGVGVFFHPGLLGYWGGLGSLFFLSRMLILKKSRSDFIGLILCVVCVIFSMQRQEFTAALFVGIIMFFLCSKQKLVWSTIIGLGLIVLAFSISDLIYEKVEGVLSETRLSDGDYDAYARTYFYVESISVANSKFPFGAGLGSFGGTAAATYGSDLYEATDVGSTWWFRAGLYMTDTFWPMPIAEWGWIGAIVFFMFHIFIVIDSYKRFLKSEGFEKMLWLRAFGFVFYGLIVSLTITVQVMLIKSLLMLTAHGIAYRYSMIQRRDKEYFGVKCK